MRRPRVNHLLVRALVRWLPGPLLVCGQALADDWTNHADHAPAGLRNPAVSNPGDALTLASRVRTLAPDEARRSLRARIRGVVTTVNARSCVVQDASGPVFVRPRAGVWSRQPAVGEAWEFAGATDPGEFSPVVVVTDAVHLGEHALPEPLHPSWEQLINGSLDVELVELTGVVLERTPDGMALLTHGGEARIMAHPDYPLPRLLTPPDAPPDALRILPGSLVRVRGVFFAYRDPATRHLSPGRFLLGDGTIRVDEPAPADPFSGPTRRVADLLRFSSRADLLSRFKIVGQVLHAQREEILLTDGANGFRARAKIFPLPAEGDLVEAVGFPRLDGPSPVLLEARVRKIGHGSRPAPRLLDAFELSDEKNDATLVRIEAGLLSDASRQGERVLELQAGRSLFLARLRTADHSATPLRAGGRLRITGVYARLRGSMAGDGFELLLNHPEDIVVLEHGPWWTPRRTFAAIAALLAGSAALLVWVGLLRRTVAQRTALLEREIRERQQIEQRRLLERERARIAQDLHDDLGAGLAQIGIVGALAQSPAASPDRTRDFLAEITAKSREMVAVLEEIVWAINPTQDTAGSVRGYLCDYAQEFLRATPIACRFDTDCAQPALPLDSIRRHQLFQAFKEALTNVVKHADATEVRVRIATAAGELSVTVEDNGKGVSSRPETPKGDGMSNMRARLERMGGRCEITSRPGGGTLVSFHLPLTGHPAAP